MGMCPSGLNWYDGLVGKGTEKSAKDKRLYTVDNYIDRNTNPLHMNAHTFWNDCNQYIFTLSVSSGSLLELSIFLLESSFRNVLIDR